MMRTPRPSLWALAAAAIALIPVSGAFSTSRVFYVRDLGVYFWPRHLWLRDTIRAGELPLWDPFAGGGHAAMADALNQLFLLPVTLLRVWLPPVAGFNAWVAAPFPLLALGMWLWLRRHVSPAAAALGAAFFACAGPVASTGNFTNLSWSVALIPWVLWSADGAMQQGGARRSSVLAVCLAMQALAGEPLTLLATSVLLVAHAVAHGALRHVAPGIAAGALLSAVQMVPLAWAATRSARQVSLDTGFWSLHPLALAEALVPHLFGHAYHGPIEAYPWLIALHGREPFFFSLYIGLGALVLATCARDRFWWIVAAVALLCSLGDHTPFYSAVQTLVPPLQLLRFPAKYFVFTTLAVAVLAARGADLLLWHARGGAAMALPVRAIALASCVGAAAAVAAVVPMTPGSRPLFLSLAAFALGVAGIVAAIRQRHRLAFPLAAALCVAAVVDPLVVNSDLHPTMPAAQLGPPAWAYVAAGSHERVYVGGRAGALDVPPEFDLPADRPVLEARAAVSAQFAYSPSAWRLREVISYDLPQVWPREYGAVLEAFRRAPAMDRYRFLARSGVRYCYVNEPPPAAGPMLVPPATLTGPMALYECGDGTPRAYVTGRAIVDPGIEAQLTRMFAPDPDLDGAARTAARIVEDRPTTLVVQATAGGDGGYLTVLDSYDPAWQVEVDGQPAELLRANALFRAVRLAPGTHDVRFSYRPAAFYAGLTISVATALILLLLSGREWLTARKTALRMRQAVTAS